MNNQFPNSAKKLFRVTFDAVTEREKKVLHHVSERMRISHNTNKEFDQALTFGERLADRVATFGGSWPFIIIFCSVLLFWVALNSYILSRHGEAFDPYPYILLNLVLSMLAALQAPIIMMSQNRQAAKDRLDAAHDYEVNLKAELEIMSLHEKIDLLREQQWKELMQAQEEQIKMLIELMRKRESLNANETTREPDTI